MKKLYCKSEIWFAVASIIIYVALMGNLRDNFGDESIFSTAGLIAVSALITGFIVKNKLCEKYGFKHVKNAKSLLFFIPLILICSVNLWFGVALNYDIPHLIIAVINMALVGYVEELIFRGLLFKAIEKDSVRQAIVITSLTFGAGHIVNLLTGHASAETIVQILCAVALGFLFAMVLLKSGSLIPCIAAHSIIDITSVISRNDLTGRAAQLSAYAGPAFIFVVASIYGIYLVKAKTSSKENI